MKPDHEKSTAAGCRGHFRRGSGSRNMVCTKAFARPRRVLDAVRRERSRGSTAPVPGRHRRPGDPGTGIHFRSVQALPARSEPFSAPTAAVSAVVAAGHSMVSFQETITATA